MDTKEIGKIFVEQRKERRLSINEVSDRSRIHIKVIQDLETGVFDRFNKIYVKGFLKQYSTFLGLDSDEILKKYETIASQISYKEVSLVPEIAEKNYKSAAASSSFPALTKKIKQTLAGISLAVFLVVLFSFIGGMKSDREEKQDSGKKVQVAKRKPEKITEKVIAKVDQRTKTEVKIQAVTGKPKGFFAKKTPTLFALTLTARDESWVHLTANDRIIYVGVLAKGESKTWETEKGFIVWTGKAERLEFKINERSFGVVTKGVIKNIIVSREGIKVGNEWLAQI